MVYLEHKTLRGMCSSIGKEGVPCKVLPSYPRPYIFSFMSEFDGAEVREMRLYFFKYALQ